MILSSSRFLGFKKVQLSTIWMSLEMVIVKKTYLQVTEVSNSKKEMLSNNGQNLLHVKFVRGNPLWALFATVL